MNTIKDDSPANKARVNYERFIYAKNRSHDKFIQKYNECDAFFFSDQWDKKDIAKLAKTDRPHLTLNKIKPIILTLMGEYLQNRMEVKYVPAAGGTSEVANALTKLFIYISKEEEMHNLERDIVLEGLIGSRAYWDVRMDFDDNFKGDIKLYSPNAKNVIPDPDSDSYDPDDWNDVTLVSYMTVQDIEQKYGEDKAGKVKTFGSAIRGDRGERAAEYDEPDSFGGKDTYEYEQQGFSDEDTRSIYLVIERQYRSIEDVKVFVNRVTGEVTQIPIDWDQDTIIEVRDDDKNLTVEERKKQVIRWTVSTGSVLLHDSISPYSHFTIVPFYPVFKRGKTAGAVEDLRDPQRNYNKLRSQELHVVNSTSNGGWKVKKGALSNMTTRQLETEGSKTGLVLEFNTQPEDIQRIDPVQIPQGLDRISFKADSDLGDISGIQDEARGVARADVAGKAITARKQASLTSMALYMENLQRTREMLAKRILKLVQRYYDEERQIYITTGGLNSQTQEIKLNTPDEETGIIENDLTVGEYKVTITSTAARRTFENQQFEELKGLQELGTPVPSYLFVEYSTLDRKEEIAEELRQAAGTDTPSEEERQLAQMEKEMQLEEKQASILARKAQAALSEARAKKVLSEIEAGDLDDNKLQELLLRAREIDIKERETEGSLEIRRRAQVAQELEMLMQDDVKREELKQLIKKSEAKDESAN